uniref:TP53-target gene 5 protein isoform X3 n=1 Tax=Myodes glareolus TaxID=447135 RepID=UPI002020A350|nr:TP53-target gene 5 protein isoform X3 [Myodes glareolus]
MNPSTKKRPKNGMVSKVRLCLEAQAHEMQDKKLQDKINQPASKLIERNRLKTVLKNLSLLKLLKSSNDRIRELHSLARRDNNVKVKQKDEELQDVLALVKKPESRNAKPIAKPNKNTSEEWEPTEGSKGSPAAAPQRKKQAKPKVPKISKNHGLLTRAQKRKPHVKEPRIVFLKTYNHRTPKMNMKPLDETDQLVWFEGLPTRIHPPGRRIMCRSSALRRVKRPCTRFCSVSL